MTIVRDLAENAYFSACRSLGRLLRLATYSTTLIVERGGERQVRKSRSFHAPVLIWLAVPLMRILDTGVRVLSRQEWQERERRLYRSLHGSSIRIEAGGTLVLPCLAGETLASLLEDTRADPASRKLAIERVVVALVDLHRAGFTHGDAMAENVLVDLGSGRAHWFDFETMHDASRSFTWRRADDVRALLATCLVSTPSGQHGETLQLILDVYADEGLTPLLAASFTSILRRPLTFHLAQAGLSLRCFREIGRLLFERGRACLRYPSRSM